uniref:Si:dkeyp-81f3.4 n=1 Tax=Cyclopterus lumpus TaxID=8103 RepID=A0A8C2XIH2_CYCLU
ITPFSLLLLLWWSAVSSFLLCAGAKVTIDVATVNWVASKDFSVDMGLNQIGEYIQTWEMQHGWSHSLLFLSSTEEEQHTFHHYRARFSTTTSRRPIQETASVYFVAVVSKVNPQTLPVEVHFVVESNRLVHTAGSTRFREKWLADVIEITFF